MSFVILPTPSGKGMITDEFTPLEELVRLIKSRIWQSPIPLPDNVNPIPYFDNIMVVLPVDSASKQRELNIPKLTQKEMQVLEGLAEGLTHKQIELHYKISIRMVKEHVRNLKAKFHTDSIYTVLYRAGELGLCKKKSNLQWSC